MFCRQFSVGWPREFPEEKKRERRTGFILRGRTLSLFPSFFLLLLPLPFLSFPFLPLSLLSLPLSSPPIAFPPVPSLSLPPLSFPFLLPSLHFLFSFPSLLFSLPFTCLTPSPLFPLLLFPLFHPSPIFEIEDTWPSCWFCSDWVSLLTFSR